MGRAAPGAAAAQGAAVAPASGCDPAEAAIDRSAMETGLNRINHLRSMIRLAMRSGKWCETLVPQGFFGRLSIFCSTLA